jgi:L-methionine (R)-S-oxide reductase
MMNSGVSLKELLVGIPITDLSNFCAYIFEYYPDLNWVGFYFSDGKSLKLGPFQGRVACIEIPFTKGVCGASFRNRQIMNVPDVELFPGHIACDHRSMSELVIPMIQEGEIFGVLDLDSPKKNRFVTQDEEEFYHLLQLLLEKNPHLKTQIKSFF